MLIDLETHGLLEHCIDADSIILDLGANQGAFARAARARFGCRVFAVEPNPNVFAELQKIADVQSICAAVGSGDGQTALHINHNSQASTLRPIDGSDYVSETIVDVFSYTSLLQKFSLKRVDLLKVDIEGYETELLAGMSDEQIKTIGQISMELHDFNGMISTQQADDIEDRFRSLGFERIALSRSTRENVLFYQPGKCRVSTLKHVWARHVTRNRIGIGRMVRRRFGGAST